MEQFSPSLHLQKLWLTLITGNSCDDLSVHSAPEDIVNGDTDIKLLPSKKSYLDEEMDLLGRVLMFLPELN